MPLTQEQKESWRSSFKEVDKDNDGKINSKELKNLFETLSIEFSDDELKELV